MKFHHQKISTGMNFEEVLRGIYPTETKYRIAAAYFLRSINSGENNFLDGYELNKICDENSISRATMQKVFVHLRKLGIVERREAKYYTSNEFGTALRRLSDAWKKIHTGKKFEFDKTRLEIDL